MNREARVGWLLREFKRAKARTALLPAWTRPTVTRPDRSGTPHTTEGDER